MAAVLAAAASALAMRICVFTCLTCSGLRRLMGTTCSPFAATPVGAIIVCAPKVRRTSSNTTLAAFLPPCSASVATASENACWLSALSKVIDSRPLPEASTA